MDNDLELYDHPTTLRPNEGSDQVTDDCDIERLIRTVMDCSFKIHRSLGPGLLESAYKMLLADQVRQQGLAVEIERPIGLRFENSVLNDVYRLDMLVEDQLIIELKSVEKLAPVHKKQLLTYLRITHRPVGLLINFGEALLKNGFIRVINNQSDYISPYKSRAQDKA